MIQNILLKDLKNYLDITWEDPAGDEKLAGILLRGMGYLNHIAGAELNYMLEDKPRELLFDYVRYVRSNSLDEFQGDYLHELLALRQMSEVAQAEAEEEGPPAEEPPEEEQPPGEGEPSPEDPPKEEEDDPEENPDL